MEVIAVILSAGVFTLGAWALKRMHTQRTATPHRAPPATRGDQDTVDELVARAIALKAQATAATDGLAALKLHKAREEVLSALFTQLSAPAPQQSHLAPVVTLANWQKKSPSKGHQAIQTARD